MKSCLETAGERAWDGAGSGLLQGVGMGSEPVGLPPPAGQSPRNAVKQGTPAAVFPVGTAKKEGGVLTRSGLSMEGDGAPAPRGHL